MSNATPMDMANRIESYWRINGVRKLTPRQRRRHLHKRNHIMAPFGWKLIKQVQQ